MADSVDAPLLRVPFEGLKRAAKERKAAVDELEAALAEFSRGAQALAGASQAAAPGGGSAAAADEAATAALEALRARLGGLKRKLGEVGAAEAGDAARVAARLAHVRSLGPLRREAALEWSKPRLARLTADHLARAGCLQTAGALAAAEPSLGPLLDLHLFAGAAPIAAALRARDCGPALAWCAEHGARLRRLRSRLEFDLRLQEFLELARSGQRAAAVAHARSTLSPWAGAHLPDLQRVMAALLLGPHTRVPAYAPLFLSLIHI